VPLSEANAKAIKAGAKAKYGVPFDFAQGRLLLCATDDETVCCFGRDDISFWPRRWKTTAKTTAGPSTAQFARCANCFAQDDTFGVGERTNKARATTTADSFASLRNDKQRCGMTRKCAQRQMAGMADGTAGMADEVAEWQVKRRGLIASLELVEVVLEEQGR
jgi:hypothetical protein